MANAGPVIRSPDRMETFSVLTASKKHGVSAKSSGLVICRRQSLTEWSDRKVGADWRGIDSDDE